MSTKARLDEPEWRTRRREAILQAARALFAVASYDAVQMDEIAELAKVGKPTLYRYFPSKRDLYLSVCADAFAELSDRLTSAGSSPSPPLTRLGEILTALLEVLNEQLVTLDFLNTSDAVLTRKWRELYSQRRKEMAGYLTAAIDEAIRSGELREVDSEFLALVLLGAGRGALLESPVRCANEIVTNLLDMFLAGISPSTARRTWTDQAFTPGVTASPRN